MRSKFLIGAILAGFLAAGYSFTLGAPTADAADAKNLKVLPKNMDKKSLKKLMKKQAKAVGKSCDDCHDISAFDKDTEMKEKGRDMMRLVNTINAKLKKDGFKAKVSCATCHRGKEEPDK
jgi:hypothetical protein